MDEEKKKIIEEQMKRLPKDVMGAILSANYKIKLQEITKRQRLLIDQAAKLEMETFLVMLGLEPLKDYLSNLQKEIGLPIIKTQEIVADVNENIFKPIRESLRAVNEAIEAEEAKKEIERLGAGVYDEKIVLEKPADSNLNRAQILDEIENPVPNRQPVTSTEIEIRPAQEIETLPGEIAKTVVPTLVETKMTQATIIPQQITEAKPETKLPEVVKKRPSSGVDPYREAIS